jgi:hypothetical protein
MVSIASGWIYQLQPGIFPAESGDLPECEQAALFSGQVRFWLVLDRTVCWNDAKRFALMHGGHTRHDETFSIDLGSQPRIRASYMREPPKWSASSLRP